VARRAGAGSARRSGFRGLGGGAASAVYTPSSVSGCVLDCIADASQITLVSGKVSQWNDRSSQANHLVQATDANRPTVGANAFATGKDGVVFAIASVTSLAKTLFAGLGGTSPELTVAYAMEWVGNPNAVYNVIFSFGAGWESLSLVGVGQHDANYGGTENMNPIADAADSRHTYINWRTNVSTNTVRTRRDGVDSSTTGTLTALGSATPTAAIGVRAGTSSFPLGAKVRAICAFNRTLTADELTALGTYLTASMA
jgi:hypothetical protein